MLTNGSRISCRLGERNTRFPHRSTSRAGSEFVPDYGTWVRRQPLLALPGTPVWTTVQTQAGEGLRRQFAALTPGQTPPTVVGPEQIRLAGLHGHLLRQPRPAVPFRLLAGSPGRRNAAAGDDARTAEPGTRDHRTLGGRRQHGRHGRMQPAAGQRRDPPRRSRADRDADVAGPRLAMRGPAGRGQSVEPHPARHSRIEQYLRTDRRTLATAAASPRGGRHPGHAR